MEIFPWTKEFQGLCKSSLTPTRSTTLIMLMTFLLSNARNGMELCYKKSLRAAKLKEIIKEALPFFTYLHRFENSEDKKQAQYFETMSDLLAIYVDLELISSKRDVQPQTESISNRISSYIILNLENLTEYMLETLMKVSLISESYNNILDPVFMRIFTRIPTNPETEIMFVRYLLVFKLWKRMKSNINDRAKIQSAAMRSLGPVLPEALPKSIVERVLPESSDSRMTKSYLRAPIDFRKACAEFLDYVREKRSARRKNATVVVDKERNPRLNCSNVIEDVTNKVDRVNSSLNKINKLDSRLDSKIDPRANHNNNNNVGKPKQITNKNINNNKVKNNDILIDLTDDDITKVIKLSKRKKIGWLEDVKKHTELSANGNNKITLSAKPKTEDAFASNFTKITITPEIHYDRKAFAASPPVRCAKADATSDESTFESVDISEAKDKKPEVSTTTTTTVDDKAAAAAAAVEQEKTTTTTTQQSPTAVVEPRLIVSTPTTPGQNKKRKSDSIIAPDCVERNNMSEKEEKPVSKALPRPLVNNNVFEKDEVILPAPLTNGMSEKENKPIIEVSKSVLVVNKSKRDDQPVPTVLKSPVAKPNEKIDTEALNKSSVIIDPSVQKDKMDVDVVPPRCQEFQHRNSSQIRDSILVSTKNLQDSVAKVAKQISALRDADHNKKAPKKHEVEEKSAAVINNQVLSDTDHVFTEINKSLGREKSISDVKDEKTVGAKLDVGSKAIRVASEESLRESKLSPVKIKSPLAMDFNDKIDEPFMDAEKYADIVQANDIDGLTLLATISARHVKVKSELDSAAAEYLSEKMMKLEADANPRLHQEAAYGHEFKFDPASIDGSNEHPNVILNGETVRLFQKSPNSNLYIINKAEMEEIKFNYQNTAQQLQQQIKTEFKPDPETAYLHGRDVVAEKKQKSVVVSQTPPPPEPYDHHRYPSYLPPNPYCAYAHVRGAHLHDCHCALFRAVPAYYVPPTGASATSNIVQSDMAVHECSNSSSGGKRMRDESQKQLEKVMGSAVEQMQKEQQQQQQQQNKRAKVESRNNVRSSGSSSSSSKLPIKKRYMAEHKLQEEEYNQHRRTPVPLAVESVSPRMLLDDCRDDSDIFNFATASLTMHEKPPQSPSAMLLDLGATVEVTSSTESPTTAAAAAPSQRGRGRPSGTGSSSVPGSRKRKSNANDNVGVIVEKKAAKKTTVANASSSSSSSSNNSNSKKAPRASKRAVPVVNYTQLQSDDQASPASKRKRKKNAR
ncbi:hypothetical protein TKK_0000464 [Trichogramma kaykai]|uniref:Uncharacterized protein n=1 Tax=Trichogramma kaykai TaxID=54128 RepID=A0ABD2WKS8_9HYME